MEIFIGLGYVGLFLISFLAATILPFSSEVVLTALLYTGFNLWTCVIVATIGNWFGGLTCYGLGRLGRLDWIYKFLKIKQQSIDKWTDKLQRYSGWAAFFSFLPGVGDIIAVVAGLLKANIWLTSTCILLGKFFRYLIWIYFSYEIFINR